MSIEHILLEDENQLYEAVDGIEDALFKCLIENELLSNTQYRSILLESAKHEGDILTEAAGKVELKNATKHSVTLSPDNVTITPEQFRQVWTDYDRYPTVDKIYAGLGIPRGGVADRQQEGTKKNHLGWREGRSSLVDWYNSNNPNDPLVYIQRREDVYSSASKNMRGGDDTDPYQPDDSRRHINPGKRGRNSSKIEQLNKTNVVSGEFYNNMTRISPRRWSHWVKFWDRRLSSVQPNKRKLLGAMIGKTWKKTFLLGYQVDRTTFYEVWYNSLNSTFSIYDKNGVQQGTDLVTLQEAIQNLIHMLAQIGSTDTDVFVGDAHGANLHMIAKSVNNVLNNELGKSVGALTREKELLDREAKENRADMESRRAETNKRRTATIGATRERQATMAGLSKDEYVFIRRAEKAVKMYEKEIERLNKALAKEKRDGNAAGTGIGGTQGIEVMLKKAEANKQEAIDLIRVVRAGEAKIDKEGRMVADHTVTPSMLFAVSAKGMKKISDGVSNAIKAASAGAAGVMSDLHQQQDELDNIQSGRKAREILNTQLDAVRARTEEANRKAARYGMPSEIIEEQNKLMMVMTGRAIAKFNAQHDRNDWQEIDQTISNVRVNEIQAMSASDAKKAWQKEADRLAKEEERIRTKIDTLRARHNADGDDASRKIATQATSIRTAMDSYHPDGVVLNESFDDIFADLTGDASNEPQFDPRDRRVNQHFSQIKREADSSPYTASAIIQGVMGDMSTYDVTKVKRPSSLTSLPGILGRFFRGRTEKMQSPIKGTYDRAKMAIMGRDYRADFIVGFSLSDRLNMEIWYIMEPGQNGKIITHYMVFDVNANKAIRSYLPYYRNAIQVVAAKMHLQT